jgi:hypothetical protein
VSLYESVCRPLCVCYVCDSQCVSVDLWPCLCLSVSGVRKMMHSGGSNTDRLGVRFALICGRNLWRNTWGHCCCCCNGAWDVTTDLVRNHELL